MLGRQAVYITRWQSIRASCWGPGRASAAVRGHGLALSSGQLVLARRFRAGCAGVPAWAELGKFSGAWLAP